MDHRERDERQRTKGLCTRSEDESVVIERSRNAHLTHVDKVNSELAGQHGSARE
jgi:hypothetical protein